MGGFVRMKSALAGLGLSFLAACDGSGSTETPAPIGVDGVTSSIANPVDLKGYQMSGPGTYVLNSGGVYVDFVPVELVFDNANKLSLTLFGETPVTLTWDAGQQAYMSADGYYKVMAFNDSRTPDVYVFKMIFAEQAVGYDVTNYFVSGNYTGLANMPAIGKATYKGNLEVTDQLANVAAGTVSIAVNFQTTAVTGKLAIGDGTVMGPAAFNVNGQLLYGDVSSVSATLDSTDVPVTSSGLDGAIFGSHGQNLAGVFFINTDKDSLAGAYVAK
jgi:hypothetical protein